MGIWKYIPAQHSLDWSLLLQLKKCFTRVSVDDNFQDNSVRLFTKLGWLPIGDIICQRKFSLFHQICHGHGPKYLSSYVNRSRVVMMTTQEPQEEIENNTWPCGDMEFLLGRSTYIYLTCEISNWMWEEKFHIFKQPLAVWKEKKNWHEIAGGRVVG